MNEKTRRPVNSHDVARKAGVSQSTVSLVLNGRANRISEETRQRVLEAARQLNYSRNHTARALVTGRTQRIGIVANSPYSFWMRDNYYGEVLTGVTSGALDANQNLLLHTSQFPDWQGLYHDILSGATDGVLMVGYYPFPELPLRLIESGFPTVCVSFEPEHERAYSVDCDNVAGGKLGIEHLLSLGHRHIVFAYAGDGISWVQQRKEGVIAGMLEAGQKAEQILWFNLVAYEHQPIIWARRLLAEMKACASPPTAVYFADEGSARHFVETIAMFGVRVPEDIAVIGFNSTEMSARSRPPLTSVRQPLSDIGEAAVKMLMDRIEGRPIYPRRLRFPVTMDVRETCGGLTGLSL